MNSNKELQVIYIAGNGHSGSTLLDIMLGNASNDIFSAGELSFIVRDSIMEEYCSCKTLIPKCDIWAAIFAEWERKRKVSYKEYQSLRHKFERNKTLLRLLKNIYFPGEDFKAYLLATKALFYAIHKVTGANIIIDSSKNAGRIPILKRIVDTQVIHICRDFKGVLNSAKKASKKDIEAGVEEDFPVRGSKKTLIDWILNNTLCEFFCRGVKHYKLKYAVYIKHPDELIKINPIFEGLQSKAPYSAPHMLAGNKMRLNQQIKVDSNLGFSCSRLSSRQLAVSRIVDKVFWFWS
ncbi:hypothetical protein [Mangrovimonas aestuarii]|uniref:hypothetical protein n=1 Tax=Mangrovimonas aestuarii TaxID=3018443 RepID=UPI002378CC78|nr:hypothetical protein [Mangrovimonas aestuarii]